MSDRYDPIETKHSREINGRTVEWIDLDYSEAHALRQADAAAALEDIEDDSSVVLRVKCRDRTIAVVHDTGRADDLDLIIAVLPASKPIDGDLHAINREDGRTGDARIRYDIGATLDPLRAPGDRDLEHPCRCGETHRLDSRYLLERIAMGTREVRASDTPIS